MAHVIGKEASKAADNDARSWPDVKFGRRDVVPTPGLKLSSLELGRGIAALYVCAFHGLYLIDASTLPRALAFVLAFGPQAVIFFFVLSGTVIRYSVDASPKTVHAFIRARVIRLVPIYLMMVVISAILDLALFGQWKVEVLLGHFAFLQTQKGFICGTFKSNPALWSMSYEAWFYALFALVLSTSKSRGLCGWVIVSALAIACAAVLPKDGAIAQATYVIGYSSAWLLGYFAIDLSKVVRFDRYSIVVTALMIPGCASVITPIDSPFSLFCTAMLFLPWFIEQTRSAKESHSVPNAGPLLAVTVVALLCIGMLVMQMPLHRIIARLTLPVLGAASVPTGYWLATWLLLHHRSAVETLGRCSYGIYVVHMPLIRLASRLTMPLWGQITFSIVGVAVTVTLLEFAFQPKAAAFLKWLFPRQSQRSVLAPK